MAERRPPGDGQRPPRSLFDDFRSHARATGLTTPAEQLAAFLALPAEAQAAMWADLLDRIDCERRDAGEIA